MYQELIVGFIGIVVLIIVAYKIYKFFGKSEQKGPCGCSNCGCTTKYKDLKY